MKLSFQLAAESLKQPKRVPVAPSTSLRPSDEPITLSTDDEETSPFHDSPPPATTVTADIVCTGDVIDANDLIPKETESVESADASGKSKRTRKVPARFREDDMAGQFCLSLSI